MKIFITGGNGFLGQHLCRRLLSEGHELTAPSSKECNLKDAEALSRFSEKYDLLFHLAAWTQAGDFCLHHPGEQWIVNQQLNTNVLNWWKESQPQAKLIAIGSSCCYEPGSPHVEENFMKGIPTESLYTYAMTKRMLYVGLQALSKQFGLRYLMLVPSTLYGPDYHLDGRQMYFIFDLMRKILDGKKHGKAVVLWGDGSQTRELIHVRDFIDIGLKLVATKENELFNTGSGEERSIRWFAEKLCDVIGYDPASIQYDTSKYVGAKSKVLSIEKLKRTIPNVRLTSIEDGFREMVDWYQAANQLSGSKA